MKNLFSFKKINKKKLFLLFYFILFTFNFSQAQIISEIMYDPAGSDTGNEWVEIYNDTSNDIDLATYKLFESNTNHSISNTGLYINPDGNILRSGEYAIIVDNPATFLANHAGFTGKLFDSSFSLINSGEELILKNSSLTSVFNILYVPQASSNNTGGSINFINNIWSVYKESPSASSTLEIINTNNPDINSTTTNSTTTSTSTNINQNTFSSNTSNYVSYVGNGSNRFVLGDLKLLAPKEINTVVGAQTEFFVKNIDSRNNPVITSVYWSFGDGGEGIGTSTKHRYQNAGHYNAFVETEVSNAYGVDRVSVTVENPIIKISNVDKNYVELSNESDTDLNIGRFIISSDQGMYTLSRMFLISANSKVKIDGRVLGFYDLTNVKLMTAYNTFVTKYEKENILQVDNTSTTSQDLLNVKKLVRNTPVKVVSLGLAPKKNIKLTNQDYLKVKGTTTNIKSEISKKPVISATVEIPPTNLVKKWLYWIYE